MNDVMLLPIVIVAMMFIPSAATGGAAPERGDIGRHLLGLFLLGPALGAAVGWLAITVMEQVRAKLGVRRDYESIYALGVAFLAYAAAEAVGGSGFLAAFAAGLVIAALDVELCDCFLDFGEAAAEMFLLLTFVAFGTSVIWSGLAVADARTITFVVIALAMRTIVVWPVLRGAGLEDRDRRLIALFGPRGLSSLLLALLPVLAGESGATRIFAIVCLLVIVSVVVHGVAIAFFIRREARRAQMTTTTEAAPSQRRLPVQPEPAPAAVESVGEEVPLRISLDEARDREARGESVIYVDSRTERAYREDPLRGEGVIRLPPDDAVRLAREMRLDQHATLVVYCA